MNKALKSNVIIMLGTPGSGKGTQTRLLEHEFALNYFAPGDAIRTIIKEGTDKFAKTVKDRYNRGQPQPDTVVNTIVKKALVGMNLQKGIILDPYPLSVGQAQGFMELKRELHLQDPVILSLHVGEEETVRRLSQRKFCEECHLMHLPTDKEYTDNICKRCAGALYVRPDDAPSVVRYRYQEYQKRIGEIKQFFDDINPTWWIDINGEQDIEQVYKEIIKEITM